MIGQRGLFTEPGDVIALGAINVYTAILAAQPDSEDQLGPAYGDEGLEWYARNHKDAVYGALNLTEPEP